MVFDFFRALRKVKKISDDKVIIQDIITFFLIILILVFSIINILDSNLRLYIFLAVILGIFSYIIILSKYVIKFYEFCFNVINDVFCFIFIPFSLLKQIFSKIYIFFKNIVVKCCKKFFDMISFWCTSKNKLKKGKIKNKEQKRFGIWQKLLKRLRRK